MSKEEARDRSVSYSKAIVKTVGLSPVPADLKSGPTTTMVGCGGSKSSEEAGGSFNALTTFNVIAPPGRQIFILNQIRDYFLSLNYSIDEFETSAVGGAGSGRLLAHNPADHFGFTVLSTSPPEEITIWVGTPCLRSPAPRPPVPRPLIS